MKVLYGLVAIAAVVVLVAGMIGMFNHHADVPEKTGDIALVPNGSSIDMPLPTGYTVLRALPGELYAAVQRTEVGGAGHVLVTSPGGTAVLPALPGEKLGSASSTAVQNATQ